MMKTSKTQLFKTILTSLLIIFTTVSCTSQERQTLLATQTLSPTVQIVNHRVYAVHQKLVLVNEGPGQPEKQNIWVALIQSISPYQEVLSQEITPEGFVLVTDEFNNRYAEFDFSQHPAGTSEIIQIDSRVLVNELDFDLSVCEGDSIDNFTQPERHIESNNPQIVDLSNSLARGKLNTCQQVRAFYDYTGDELVYTHNNENWGAQATMGFMGADCTEYAALLTALSRARGIPARYIEGLLYLEKEKEALASKEHAWVDVYLPGIGWVSLDPTLGRSSIYREVYFAHHTPEHIIVTIGPSPSTLRGSSYWTHMYWPGNSTKIYVEPGKWDIELEDE